MLQQTTAYNWKRRIPLCILIVVWKPVWLTHQKRPQKQSAEDKIQWNKPAHVSSGHSVICLWRTDGNYPASILFYFQQKWKIFVRNCLQGLTYQVSLSYIEPKCMRNTYWQWNGLKVLNFFSKTLFHIYKIYIFLEEIMVRMWRPDTVESATSKEYLQTRNKFNNFNK